MRTPSRRTVGIGVAFLLASLVPACSGSTSVSPQSGSPYPVPWTLVRSAPEDSSVVVNYLHGDCDALAGPRTTITATAVHIVMRVRSTVGPDGACDGAARVGLVRVRLRAPLGTRAVTGECRRNEATMRGRQCMALDPNSTPDRVTATVGP